MSNVQPPVQSATQLPQLVMPAQQIIPTTQDQAHVPAPQQGSSRWELLVPHVLSPAHSALALPHFAMPVRLIMFITQAQERALVPQQASLR